MRVLFSGKVPNVKPKLTTAVYSLVKSWFNLRGLALVGLVLVAYFPSLSGEFIWDDDSNVVKSGPLRTWDGLRQIWFEPGATQMYYPLTHTSFWLDYQLWGAHTAPYHLENILQHLLSALLLWYGLSLLKVRGAWLGAALFALHPVQVESVAWITERKNTLSGVFFMASLLAAIRFWRLDQSPNTGGALASAPDREHSASEWGAWKYYWLAVGLYLLGMLSKTAIIGLPAIVLVLVWWKRGRVGLKDLTLMLPFALVAGWLAYITILIESRNGAQGELFAFSLLERALIAARGFWFYLGKLAWPHPLMFIYPRWTIDATQPLAYLPVAGLGALGALLWAKRKTWGRPMLTAFGVFVVMLLPVSGFFNVVFFYYSFVSDHFQYLALIGPLALAAAALVTIFERRPGWQPQLGLAQGVLLILCAGLSMRQTGVYQSSEALWRDALAHNPQAWMAHANLGGCYSRQDRFDLAEAAYRESLRLNPTNFMAHNNLGLDAARQGRLEEAVQHYKQALLIRSNYPMAHYNLGNALARQGKFDDAIAQFDQTLELQPGFAAALFGRGAAYGGKGDTNAASRDLQQTLQLQPGFAPAHLHLARLLAAQGKLEEARGHYRSALASDPNSVEALTNLGNMLVAKGQLEEAVAYYRTAARLEPDSPVIHYNLGVALMKQGHQAEAQEQISLATQLQARRRGQPATGQRSQ
jgi:tetratricopeptide (TPR) repeat protein